MKIGILPLGRATFDVEYAREKLALMLAELDASDHEIVGPRKLLFDGDATRSAFAHIACVDHVLVLQVTFTDAAAVLEIAQNFEQPLSIWAVPEPRLGGRLRLNAFCGLNLASHTLGLINRPFGWGYGDQVDLGELFTMQTNAPKLRAAIPEPKGAQVAVDLHGKRIGRIGEHPVGFSTCAYDADAIKGLAGVEVEEMDLEDLFGLAKTVEAAHVPDLRGIRDLDSAELDKSLKLKTALDGIRAKGAFDAFAIRCWPETFTEYGGGVCGPVSMLGEARVPCACEADVYGALTQLLMQRAADAPVFLVDLVDMDEADNTGVVWHCGQAPLSMCDPDVAPAATIHTNRKMPLLYEFPLKPGEVTLARISQAKADPKLVLAKGEMLKREMAFTGTSGVVRFDRDVKAVLRDVIGSGLEHHMGLIYGDHRATLEGAAAAMGLGVVEL